MDVFFKGIGVGSPNVYPTDAVMVEFDEVISGEYTPFFEKGHKTIFMLYKQIHDRLLVDLNDIDRNRPK
jgi:hypothetical protein